MDGNEEHILEKIKIVTEQRAYLSAQFNDPRTTKKKKMRIQGELALINSELIELKRLRHRLRDEGFCIQLKNFLILRWPNVWEEFLKIQEASKNEQHRNI